MSETISTVSEYVKTVSKINSTLIRNGTEKNEILLFRGQSDSNYELIPAIARHRREKIEYGEIWGSHLLFEERNLIEMAKYKLPDVFRSDLSPIELLALLQHYGIPTRLLDVTENALVALYFACNQGENKDGEVFLFKNNELYISNYPLINAIADSYRLAEGTPSLSSFYESSIIQSYFLEQRKDCERDFDTSDDGGKWIERVCKRPIFVYAPIRSLRQQVQCGRYILFPNHIEDYIRGRSFFKDIDPIPKDHNCIAGIITIPKDEKKQILKDLKLFGISEETLFRDNIDIVCKNIKETYQDKVRGESSCLT